MAAETGVFGENSSRGTNNPCAESLEEVFIGSNCSDQAREASSGWKKHVGPWAHSFNTVDRTIYMHLSHFIFGRIKLKSQVQQV